MIRCTPGRWIAISSETVSRASAFTTRVSRPDLLALGALLHDIGKGRGANYSEIGAELAVRVGERTGLWPSDVRLLSAMVRHHLLLTLTATRRDVADATISEVVEALDGDSVLLELLHAQAEADALATGPGVWSDWKSTLIGDLVRRCRTLMAGDEFPEPEPIAPEYLALAADGRVHVEMKPGECATHLRHHDDRPGPPRPAVQGGRCAGPELARRAVRRGEQRCAVRSGFGDQHLRGVAPFRRTPGGGVAAPAVHHGPAGNWT